MDCSMQGFPIHQQLPKLAQTHVHCGWWCHPTTSSSVVPFSSRLQSFLASGSFLVSQFFTSCGWSIGASASVLPVNIQDWVPLRLTGLISLHPRDSQKSSPTSQFKRISSLVLSFLYSPILTSIHDYWKNHSFDETDLCWQIMSLPFIMLSRLVIAFLPRRKNLLISRLQSPSAVILEPKTKVCHCFHCFPIYFPWSDGTRCHDLRFLNVEF